MKLDCAGTTVCDFWCNCIDFFIKIIIQFRSLHLAGEDTQKRTAKIFRNYDCRVIFSGFDSFNSIPGIDCKIIACCIFVVIGNGYFNAGGVAVWVNIGCNIEPGIQRGDNTYADHDQHGSRTAKQTFHVPAENPKCVPHK